MLTSLRAPRQLLQDLDKVRRRFLWAGDSELTGAKCKVSWPLVTRPVEFGGLGILELDRFSRALRLRWLWLAWGTAQRPWQGMELPVDGVDLALFSAATRVTVQNGNKASFWFSSWIDGQSPASRFPLLCSHSRRKNRSVREALVNGKWICDIAYNLNEGLLKEFFELWQLIQDQRLELSSEQEDQIIWTLESSGEYSSRSAYKIQFAGQISSTFPKLIWKACATPRCKFFLWLLLQSRIWTADRLQQRGWENNYFCALCVRNLETPFHLFVECPVARKIWGLVASWSNCANLQPRDWSEHTDMEEWFLEMIEKGTKAAHSIAILTIWHIWKERNARVFNDSRSTELVVVNRIKDECSDWITAGGKSLRSLRLGNNVVSN